MKTRSETIRNRRGYSLIEMVVVIGAVTVVLSLCGMILHGLLKLDKSGRAQLDDAATIGRISRQFRADVRDASSAEILKAGDKPSGLKIVRDGATISYAVDGRRLIRVASTKDGKPRNRESYRVDRIGPVVFEAVPPTVQLTFLRAPSEPKHLPHPAIRIVGELGKDLRLGQPSETTP